MAPMWTKISRSKHLELMLGCAIMCYISFVLISNVKLHQRPPYPWTTQGQDFIPWRDRLNSHELSEATKKLVRHNTNSTATPNQTEKNDSQRKPEPGCTKTIASLTKYSSWFRDRYNPKVKLFLDKADISNYSAYVTHGLPFGFRGQNHSVFDKMLSHENFTNPSIHGAGRKAGCVRCAVVGCGGILNGSGAGQEIDGHDYIFRLNKAVSNGRFAADVGRRTTFYTFFPESQRLSGVEDKIEQGCIEWEVRSRCWQMYDIIDKQTSANICCEPSIRYSLVQSSMIAFYAMFKAYDVAYALKTIQQDKSPRYTISETSNGMRRPGIHPSKLKLIHPGFVLYVSEGYLGKKKRPTTGSIVVILSLHICDEVTIYGFGYDSRYTLHYYDSKFVNHTQKSTASHNVDNERDLWIKLHEEGVIRFFKRDL